MGKTQQRSCWICRRFAPDNTQYDMTRSIISLGKAAALDPRKELRSLHSCSGQAVLKDSSSGFNMYREPAYSPALSIADQHPGLLNMLRSPIFALGTLGVGNRPAAGLHRTIGISATPPSLWPGCELQKYLLWSTGRLNYSVFKERSYIENLQNLGLPKNYPSNW